MNTSILTIALTSALLAGNSVAPSWQNDYFQAQKQAVAQRKPLVVVFGTNPGGWAKVIRTEKPAAEVGKLLAENYVCVFVNTATPSGRELANNFDIRTDVGLVISDRRGEAQAFWHQGDVANDTLIPYLQKYADPNVMVRQTETTNTSRTSYYPFNNSPARTISSANC